MQSLSVTASEFQEISFIHKVYGWMTLALIITAVVAGKIDASPTLLNNVLHNTFLMYGLFIAELGLVFGMSLSLNRLGAPLMWGGFLLYSVLNGITLSVILSFFTTSSIAGAFFVTALTFGIMSLYGFFTKKDLTSLGGLALMALVGLVISTVINIWLKNNTVYWITTYAGILIFVGLTAYDTQKIKNLNSMPMGNISPGNLAVMGALMLYLDFINLFLRLLQVVGRRKD